MSGLKTSSKHIWVKKMKNENEPLIADFENKDAPVNTEIRREIQDSVVRQAGRQIWNQAKIPDRDIVTIITKEVFRKYDIQ